MRSGRTRLIGASLGVIALMALTACTGDIDDVLVRQVYEYKRAYWEAVRDPSWPPPTRAEFVNALRSGDRRLPVQYWDGESDPTDLDLAGGGIVVYGLRDVATEFPEPDLHFDVLIYSGPRDADADLHDHGGAYSGPGSVYTCFTTVVEFAGDRVWDTSTLYAPRDPGRCDENVVRALPPGAHGEDGVRFDG